MASYHSSVETRERVALKQMLREFPAQHVLTLAFHEQIDMRRATEKVAKWYRRLLRRLFGRQYFELPPDQRLEFLLLPEAGGANLHFHGLTRIPESHVAYFERIAVDQWKCITPRGTGSLDVLRPTAAEREEWYSYITKGSLAVEVLHSSMLALPEPENNRIGSDVYRRRSSNIRSADIRLGQA